MARYTRGEFLGFSAALADAFTLGRWPRGGRRMPSLEQTALALGADAQMTVGEPDLVVVNARVFTSDTASPRAEAFAIKNGRFVAVGSTSDVTNLATARTPVIDAQRMEFLKGLLRSGSIHLSRARSFLNLGRVRSRT